MDDKKESKLTDEAKEIKETKKQIKLSGNTEEELIIAYAQLALHTLQHTATEITPKTLKTEIKMFYEKFGNQEVRRLTNIIMKEKKEKK